MKKLAKPIFVVIALLILIFSVLSVSGFSYYTGDIKHTVFKGFGSLDWGIDVSGGTELAVKVASSDEAHYVNDVREIVRKRASYFGLTDYELYVNTDEEIIIIVPNSVPADMDAAEIASLLTSEGNFTLRPGNGYQEFSIDSSNNAVFSAPSTDTVILDSNRVKNASVSKYTESGYTYNFIDVSFNEEGATVLAQLTHPDTGTYYNRIISAWLDDRMIGYQTMSNQLVSGVYAFTNDGMTDSNAKLISAVIKSGPMPCDLEVSYIKDVPPAAGNNAAQIICFTGFAALLSIAIIMIYKYKAGGVVTLFALFMQFSGILAILTGFVGEGHTFMLTVEGAGAFALSVILTVFCCAHICNSTRNSLANGKVLSAAFESAYMENKNKILDATVLLALISFVGLLVFGKSGISVSLFGASAASGIYNFSYVLFFGSVLNFINGYILPKLMFRSLLSYKAFDKASMFGGVVNE